MMRKRIIGRSPKEPLPTSESWLDIDRLAEVEVTSEEADNPVESAFIPGGAPGWRASETGEQTIRLLFDKPLTLRRVYLVFEEDRRERVHEFVLSWSDEVGMPYREIVRQQYTFTPTGTNREVEDYAVNLNGVKLLELKIVPDISGGDARATLKVLRLA